MPKNDKKIKKIDDEQIAKEAIATSPDVTNKLINNGEKVAAGQKPLQGAKEPLKTFYIDENQVEKEADIMRAGVSSAFEQVTGGNFSTDQEFMVSALAKEVFTFMQEQRAPRAFKIGLLGLICIVPFIPAFVNLKKNIKGSKNGND